MENTTRISDLPDYHQQQQHENIKMTSSNFLEPQKVSRPRDENAVSMPTYQPMMDVHPNPYIPKPTNIPDFSSPDYGVPLPSRDYPRETINYLQDEQIKVDYIPPPKITNDFISRNDRLNQENWDEHRQKKHRLSKLDHLINEFQTPFFLTLLFILFQLPMFNSLFFKYFSFLSIHHSDGNLNMYGIVFKAVLYGLSYYFAIKTMDYFTEP
jgi:hypothetical protein